MSKTYNVLPHHTTDWTRFERSVLVCLKRMMLLECDDVNFDIREGLALMCHKRPENKPNRCIYFYINDILKNYQEPS